MILDLLNKIKAENSICCCPAPTLVVLGGSYTAVLSYCHKLN